MPKKFVLIVLFLYPILLAQTPYEYFEFRTVEQPNFEQAPPVLSSEAYPMASPMPEVFGIDEKTGKAGDLSLLEPFAPPVGIYQRRQIYGHPTHRDGEFFAYPVLENCRPWSRSEGATSGTYRSGLVYVSATPDALTILPSDSPEMEISSIEVVEMASSQVVESTLYRCDGGQYALDVDAPGIYRVAYETRSPTSLLGTRDAEFFRDLTRKKSLYSAPLTDAMERALGSDPELVKRMSQPHPMPAVIAYFQGFESEPLEETTLDGDTISRILTQRRGQCRHRSFLLMIASNVMGIPARMVANEVHAFVEIEVSGHWYVVETGGAARSLNTRTTSGDSEHRENISFLESQTSMGREPSTDLVPDGAFSPHARPMADSMPSRETIFVAEKDFPKRIRRGESFEISGWIQDESGRAYRHEVRIILTNGTRRSSWRITPDETGYFRRTMGIDLAWPLGETHVEWRH